MLFTGPAAHCLPGAWCCVVLATRASNPGPQTFPLGSSRWSGLGHLRLITTGWSTSLPFGEPQERGTQSSAWSSWVLPGTQSSLGRARPGLLCGTVISSRCLPAVEKDAGSPVLLPSGSPYRVDTWLGQAPQPIPPGPHTKSPSATSAAKPPPQATLGPAAWILAT